MKKWWLYTGSLSHFLHHRRYYKLVGIGLSRQANTSICQQIIFTEILEQDNGATMIFFIAEK